MEWISFFEKQPVDGQSIYYYGHNIGVWQGKYNLDWNDPVSPHRMICSEALGVVDRMDAPWWMPNDRMMSRPQKPTTPYPPDYPH